MRSIVNAERALAHSRYATIFSVPYIPLRVQSHWSLLDGVPSVSELVAHAVALGLPALALTDRNALYGAVEFVAACADADRHGRLQDTT